MTRPFEILAEPVADNTPLANALAALCADLDATPGVAPSEFRDIVPGTQYVTADVWNAAEAQYQAWLPLLEDFSLTAEQIAGYAADVNAAITAFDAQKKVMPAAEGSRLKSSQRLCPSGTAI
jgi:hypothetical protein